MPMPPGSRVFDIAARWFDPATVASVFEPLVADWQREWRDATGFARFGVRIRGGSALFLSIIAASPNVLFAPWPVSTLRRVMTRVTIWTTVVTALTLAPFVIDLPRVNVGVFLYLLVLLLPQAMAIAFPFAITTIVDLIRTASQPTREERIAAVRFAIAACALMLILCGWLFPAANQRYRVASFRAVSVAASGPARNFGPARGLRELSIVELFQDDRLRRQGHPSGDPIYDAWIASRAGAETVLREISSRLWLSLLPIALMWMRWRALLLPRGHWYSPLPLVLSAPLLFGSCMFLLRGFAVGAYVPRWIGPWLAMTVFAIASIGIDSLRRRAALELTEE